MRILHVADTHLGLRQYGLEVRREDFARAFEQVIQQAIVAHVDAVVHAGDLFDNRFPTTVDLTELIHLLQRLQAADIPLLGVVGNHEGKRNSQWLDLFSQLGLAHHLSAQTPFELHGVPLWGVDFISRNPEQVKPPSVDGGVLVMHQLLRDKHVSGQGELSLPDLYGCGARLVLLGDYHEHRVWREGETLVTYPGSSERTSAAERPRRGVSIIDYDTLSIERRELDTRRFVYIGSARQPVEDAVAEMAALDRQLNGAIVVITETPTSKRTPRQLQAEGASRGALHVIVRRIQSETSAWEQQQALMQLASLEQIDTALSQAIEQQQLHPLIRAIDDLIRDPNIPDSRIDKRTTNLLEVAEL